MGLVAVQMAMNISGRCTQAGQDLLETAVRTFVTNRGGIISSVLSSCRNADEAPLRRKLTAYAPLPVSVVVLRIAGLVLLLWLCLCPGMCKG
jgi:hypothetical protein